LGPEETATVQGVQRYVVFAYLTFGVLLWATLSKILAALAFAVDAPDFEILGSQFTLTTLLGLAIAAGSSFVAFKNEKVYGFSAEVVSELKKVTWPTKEETRTATIVVIVTTVVIAMILGVFDAVWAALTGMIY
jgi:preprotein translocase subunit SecE